MMQYFHIKLRLALLLTIALLFCIVTEASSSAVPPSFNEDKPKTDVKAEEAKEDEGDRKATHQIKRVLIYRNSDCKDCDEAKNALKKHNVEYQDIDLSWNHKQSMILRRKAGKEDVSYVFVGNEYIGNHNDLMALMRSGHLVRKLQNEE